MNMYSIKEHKSFAEKYNLNFPVLSDPGHKVRKSFGAPGLLFNMVADRITFIPMKNMKWPCIQSMTRPLITLM